MEVTYFYYCKPLQEFLKSFTILVLKVYYFVKIMQHADASEDFTLICAKQKLNALTKTCFIHLV